MGHLQARYMNVVLRMHIACSRFYVRFELKSDFYVNLKIAIIKKN